MSLKLLLLSLILFALNACAPAERYMNASPELETRYPFAAMINHSSRQLCSGSWVSPRAVLTAAHCVEGRGKPYVVTYSRVLSAERIVRFEDGHPHANDLALLVFDGPVVSESQTVPIAQTVSVDEPVHILGVGCNDYLSRGGGGTLRAGTNQVRGIGTMLSLVTALDTVAGARGILGPSGNAGACFGDSGGPAARPSASGGFSLVGVGHGVSQHAGIHTTYYVDLTRADNREFLERADAAHALGLRFAD